MQPLSRFKEYVQRVNPVVQHIHSAELMQKLPLEGFVLIDVREKEEFDRGHIPGAIHLSKGVLEVKIENIVPNVEEEIILYCGGGSRSTLAAFSLKEMGYKNVKSLVGGAKEWQVKGFSWE